MPTRLAPTMPPAPGMLSTMTCWPSSSVIRGERMRATTSIGPPAANGTTTVGGRVGQSCAGAAAVETANAASAAPTIRLAFTGVLRAPVPDTILIMDARS